MSQSETFGSIPTPDGFGGAAALDASQAGLPPSKPLQIFLLCAFVVTALAYLADLHSQSVQNDTLGVTMSKMRHLIVNHDRYLDHSRYGVQAIDKQHYDLAVYHFRAALIAADAADGHFNLALALLKQDNFAGAATEFKAALQLNPKITGVYKSWGQALMTQQKPQEAAQVYQDGLRQSPDDAGLHYNLAMALDAQNNAPQALGEYTEAARLGLDTADLWLRLGILLVDQSKLADAEVCLAKAVALKPDLGDAQFKLAVAQDQQGKFADAIKHYETMLTLSPDHPDTLNNLALIYATASDTAARNPKMALTLATRASTAANDQNSRYLDTVARSYAAGGDFTQAVAWENKAIQRAQASNQADLLKEFNTRNALFQQQKAE